MKILAISDIHRQRPKLSPCDVLIFAGDEDAYNLSQFKSFCVWLEKQKAEHKIVVFGNHDWYPYNYNAMAREVLKEHNLIYLENSEIQINGIRFWGSPITPTFMEWAFMEDRGSRIKKYWDMIPEGIDVLITHGPPYGVLDYTVFDKKNVGCEELYKAVVNRIKPKYHIFGHIHEGFGEQRLSFAVPDEKKPNDILNYHETVFLNVAQVNEDYKLTNKPVEFEI